MATGPLGDNGYAKMDKDGLDRLAKPAIGIPKTLVSKRRVRRASTVMVWLGEGLCRTSRRVENGWELVTGPA